MPALFSCCPRWNHPTHCESGATRNSIPYYALLSSVSLYISFASLSLAWQNTYESPRERRARMDRADSHERTRNDTKPNSEDRTESHAEVAEPSREESTQRNPQPRIPLMGTDRAGKLGAEAGAWLPPAPQHLPPATQHRCPCLPASAGCPIRGHPRNPRSSLSSQLSLCCLGSLCVRASSFASFAYFAVCLFSARSRLRLGVLCVRSESCLRVGSRSPQDPSAA